jgi:hypothetical protein
VSSLSFGLGKTGTPRGRQVFWARSNGVVGVVFGAGMLVYGLATL